MKWFVSRALLLGMLSEHQLKLLHEREKISGFCLPTWNACEMFGLGSLKDFYNVADDPVALRSWAENIEAQLKTKNFLKHEHEGYVGELDVDATHSFDWGILKSRGSVNFAEKSIKKGRGLLELVNE
jgi:hypothetical protein